MHYACESEDNELVKYLISLGIDINAKDNDEKTILHYLCESGNFDIVKYISNIAEANFDVRDKRSRTLLHEACNFGNVELVKFLIEMGRVEVNAKDIKGNTLLHESYRNFQLLQYLIPLKILDDNAKDENGNTVFLKATHWGNANVIKYLVTIPEVDITVQNSIGKNALHNLVLNNDLPLVTLLINLNRIP